MNHIKTIRLKFLILLILFLGFTSNTYSQNALRGNWRRVEKPKYQGIKIEGNWGDLEVYTDSTFHIQGDTTFKKSSTPGWSVGDDINGTWEIYNRNLIFWVGSKKDWFPLSYKIIKLNKKELIIRSQSDKSNKLDLRFLRF